MYTGGDRALGRGVVEMAGRGVVAGKVSLDGFVVGSEAGAVVVTGDRCDAVRDVRKKRTPWWISMLLDGSGRASDEQDEASEIPFPGGFFRFYDFDASRIAAGVGHRLIRDILRGHARSEWCRDM